MAYFEFPHTRNYDGDLGWVIKKIVELTNRYNDFFEYNQITFADPLQWDITKQYPPYQIVFDYDQGYSYISKRPVPAGVTITNADYWCLVGPLIIDAEARDEITRILNYITNIYESGTTASAPRSVGDYVIVGGILYKVTAPMNIGETYGIGFNVITYTIENMILDKYNDIMALFPLTNDKIGAGAIDTANLAAGAVTGDKIANNTITRSKMVQDKYIFIGDSFNADAHYSWGKKIAAKLNLVLDSDAYIVAVPGGGMGNGLILPQIQSLGNSMSADERSSITKIVMVFGANDWGQADANITNGIVNLETYLTSAFPNAECYLIAAQWGYLNATYRQGLLNAYNIYASSVKKIKFIDKQFILMLDPYFVEKDMVHPTDACTTNMASSIISIMQGGSGWTKYYSSLKAVISTTAYGGSGNLTLYGDITDAGTHIWRTDPTGIVYNPRITITREGTQIGIIDCTNDQTLNNFFQREATIPVIGFCLRRNASNLNSYDLFKGSLVITKRSDNDHIWDVVLKNDTVFDGAFNIDLEGLYLDFDCYLDYTHT